MTYRETRPGRYFRAYSIQFNWSPYWYFDTDLGLRSNVSNNNSVTFRNFWVAIAELHEVLSRPRHAADPRRALHGHALGLELLRVAAQQHGIDDPVERQRVVPVERVRRRHAAA